MSKLVIPASAMLGAPLSDDEMKAILGGATKYTCRCTLKFPGGAETSYEINGITTGAACRAACQKDCASTAKCVDHYISFMEEDC